MTKAEQNYARVKKYQQEHRRLGLCIECPNPPLPGKVRCTSCLERRNTKRRSAIRFSLADKRCTRCHKEPALEINTVCLPCYLKEVSKGNFGTTNYWQQLLEMFQAQGGLCTYSRRPMTLGLNAQIDHRVSLASGGDRGIENTHWVLASVNRMKRELSEEEFLSLVADIHHTRSQHKSL